MTLKASLWLNPLFTCATRILLLATGTGLSLVVATFTLTAALSLTLYSCSIVSQLKHTHRILSDSITAVLLSIKVARFVTFRLIAGVIYAWFWFLGAAGILFKGLPFTGIYILVLFLSLAWTMNVIKNRMHVAISRIAYMQLMHGLDMDISQAFIDAATKSLSSICLGSAMALAIGDFQGMARAMTAVDGGSDEFLFFCATCYIGLADQLIPRGNWWGFVHVGVHSKGFVQASRDVWELFFKHKMVSVIDRDFTAVFYFLYGIIGSTAMVGGSWMLDIKKGYVTGGAARAFLVGYFMVRIWTARAQACMLAYHVVYAENPMNQRLGQAMSEWLKEPKSSPL
ncbi:hypothetical protein J5N97_026516 [Dioscorea zingiberensis]|uniref:Choline transporter-like protein n=1 Tax=Dioscorea zingiberensis TaxID=325984 RepID=A0A9D5C329_9LILI|nr:hypothetical protein J5N97_026516 [Dioscorea zingiberensis]